MKRASRARSRKPVAARPRAAHRPRGGVALDPSNDAPPEVYIEMRAVRIEATRALTYSEQVGWRAHELEQSVPVVGSDAALSGQYSGWLARELATHPLRESRDASAWAWRIDRPLAEQLAGTAADDAAADVLADLRDDPLYAEVMEANVSGPEMPADRSPVRDVANTADLDAKGPAWNALNDAEDFDLQAGGLGMTTAEMIAAYIDPPLTVTIDSDGAPAAQINGLCEVPPLFTPDDAESLADDLMLGADAARQAARDGHHHPAVVVELLAGSEPEQGVEFEIEPDGAR